MPEAEHAYTTRRAATRFLSEAEPHLLRIECGLELMALVEASSGPGAKLIGYIVDRMAEDARQLRATLYPEVRS